MRWYSQRDSDTRATDPKGATTANWKEQAAHAATVLIAAAGAAAIINASDIKARANLVKSHSTDSSSVEASAIAQKIRDDIKTKRRDITISGSL